MSTTARKVRKRSQRALRQLTELTGNAEYAERASRQYRKAQKTPTPLVRRSFVVGDVMRKPGDLIPAGFRFSVIAPRSPRRIAKFLQNGGIPR